VDGGSLALLARFIPEKERKGRAERRKKSIAMEKEGRQ
jgi:hypothetical protein